MRSKAVPGGIFGCCVLYEHAAIYCEGEIGDTKLGILLDITSKEPGKL